MPTTNPQKKITITAEEWRRLSKGQRPEESDSNFLRRKLGLKELQHGGARKRNR